jgi:hypothetical protein
MIFSDKIFGMTCNVPADYTICATVYHSDPQIELGGAEGEVKKRLKRWARFPYGFVHCT